MSAFAVFRESSAGRLVCARYCLPIHSFHEFSNIWGLAFSKNLTKTSACVRYSKLGMVIFNYLTHLSLAFHKRDIGNRCRP